MCHCVQTVQKRRGLRTRQAFRREPAKKTKIFMITQCACNKPASWPLSLRLSAEKTRYSDIVIYMKLSTRAPPSFLYVYSLARNAERSIMPAVLWFGTPDNIEKIYTYVCMRACSILSSATITVIEHINKATDFKRLGVGRANVGIFYSFLFSHLVPTETTIYRLISKYIRVSKSFSK